MTAGQVAGPAIEARRALVLHDRPLVVDLITLTLNHGVFAVRAASSLAEAKAILEDWVPNMSVVDMDHDDSTAVLKLLGASNTLKRSGTPVLGLTRRGDLKTKLRAFDLGVDDILTMPFSPEELLARAVVISRRATGIDLPLIPVIKLGEIEIDIVNRVVRAGTRSSTSPASSRACSTSSRVAVGASSTGKRSSTRSGAWTSWPRATSWTATSGACASSSRTTTAIRASSPPSPARAIASSRPSPTRAGAGSRQPGGRAAD